MTGYTIGKGRGALDAKTVAKADEIARRHLARFLRNGTFYWFDASDRGALSYENIRRGVEADLKAAGLFDKLYPGLR